MKKSDILDLLESSPAPMTKRDIASAFGIKGSGPRVAMKKILHALEQDGSLIKHPGGAYSVAEGLPAVMVLEVFDIDVDGDVFARPIEWDEEAKGPPPIMELKPGKKGHPAAGKGDRVLARIERLSSDNETIYIAYPIRRMDEDKNTIVGLFELTRSGAALSNPPIKKPNTISKSPTAIPMARAKATLSWPKSCPHAASKAKKPAS